jgi:hypothetical protein
MSDGDDERPFAYPNEQWARIADIVESAGGPAARDKLDAIRLNFTRDMARWPKRFKSSTGRKFCAADVAAYTRVAFHARGLLAIFDDMIFNEAFGCATDDQLPFPVFFTDHDSVWKRPTETALAGLDLVRLGRVQARVNRARFAKFLNAIDHVARRAETVTKPDRKQALRARNVYFLVLGRVWHDGLGLEIKTGVSTHFAQFVEAVSKGVFAFTDGAALRKALANEMMKDEWVGSKDSAVK